jgi:hypothetical protein
MSSGSSQYNIWQMDRLANWPLLKSDDPMVSGLRWTFSPGSCKAFRSIPSDLYQLEVLVDQLLRGCQSTDNQFKALQNQEIEGFQSMVPCFLS